MNMIFEQKIVVYIYIYIQVLREPCCKRDDIIHEVVECIYGVVDLSES